MLIVGPIRLDDIAEYRSSMDKNTALCCILFTLWLTLYRYSIYTTYRLQIFTGLKGILVTLIVSPAKREFFFSFSRLFLWLFTFA